VRINQSRIHKGVDDQVLNALPYRVPIQEDHVLQNPLLKELVAMAKACEDGNPIAVGALFLFLDETDGMSLYLAASDELALHEPNLTEKERGELRDIGVSFYDEGREKPVEFLVRQREDDGLLPNT
jgi:hypothetical protein